MFDQAGNSLMLTLVGILLTIIGFFLVGLIKRVEQNNENLNKFCTKLEVLVENIKTVQADATRSNLAIEKAIDRQEKAIELIRARIHYLMNKITAIKLKLELSGIHLSSEGWDPPSEEET